jgi:hypothetical protein
MDKIASSTAAPDENRLDLVRLVLIAAVLPAVIAAVNYALLAWIQKSPQDLLAVWTIFGWYVLQVGIIGFAVGRGVERTWLRWVVFGWNFLFINLLAVLLVINPYLQSVSTERLMPRAALIAGQLGLCVVWAFFGDTRWVLRWPAMILAVAGLFVLWLSFGTGWKRQMWTELLMLQVATLSVLCGGLRRFRYRLLMIGHENQALSADDQRLRPLQFGIKDVLIWTTVLATFLGVAKALDMLSWSYVAEFMQGAVVWKSILAATSAIVMVLALWVALGEGPWVVRYGAGLLISLLLGVALGGWSTARAGPLDTLLNRSPLLGEFPQSYYDLLRCYQIGYWWIGWLFLSGGLLAATLIILRVQGYRLVRIR